MLKIHVYHESSNYKELSYYTMKEETLLQYKF